MSSHETNEGKLKRLIQKWVEYAQDGCKPKPHIEEMSEYIIYTLNKIVDEAVKEFPDKSELTDGQFDSAVQDWFKKWFGGKEET